MKKFQIELNERELYILWFLASWFQPVVTSSLIAKLYPGIAIRKKYEAKGFGDRLEQTLVEQGLWLKDYFKRQKGD